MTLKVASADDEVVGPERDCVADDENDDVASLDCDTRVNVVVCDTDGSME